MTKFAKLTTKILNFKLITLSGQFISTDCTDHQCWVKGSLQVQFGPDRVGTRRTSTVVSATDSKLPSYQHTFHNSHQLTIITLSKQLFIEHINKFYMFLHTCTQFTKFLYIKVHVKNMVAHFSKNLILGKNFQKYREKYHGGHSYKPDK